MPQITFEHSANLTDIDYNAMFASIYNYMSSLPNTGTCKIRAMPQAHFFIGAENGENAFASLKVSIATKAERTAQFKKNIAENLMPIVTEYLNPVKKRLNIKCFPTVEVTFLSEQYYRIED